MKTEDIDKKIGMPDVDAEWARFEHEVISGGTKRRSALAWAFGIGIAASVALLLIINIGKEQMEQVPLIAQTEEIKPQPTPQPIKEEVQPKEQEVVKKASTPVIAQNKRPASTNANASPTSSLDIPAREYTGAVQKPKMNDMEGLAFESVDQALQDIASADLSSGTTMRLRGIGDNKIDSFLVVVNGKTLFDSRGMTSEETERRLEEYLNEQGLLQDIKIPWKNGAIEIYASTPEEREERQRMIANATIVPNPSYFGSNSMRLHGTGDYRPSDKDRMDSTLILINGEPLPEHLKQEVLGNDPDDIDTYVPRYFYQQHQLLDEVYVHKDSEFTEKFGGRAKYGVIEIKTVPDTYCDAYVRKHLKLMQKYSRVEGYVVGADGKLLTEAWVHIKKKSLTGAATDSTGHYAIWLPTRDVTLCADHPGYKSFEFSPADSMIVTVIEPISNTNNMNMRLRGSLQEQIASLPKYVPDEDEVRLLPQGTIGGSPYCPPNDSILYLVNGVPQPKENNKWLGRKSYLDYFKGQHMLVSKVMRHMTDEAKQRYIEKFGEAAKHGVVEYFCAEDTLCDYYMDQHEELKASRRRVSGVVYDENDEPLAHTMIYIWHGKRVWGFETTDSLGNFTFWVPRTDVKLNFTYVGFYKPVVVEPSDTFQTIYLLPNDNLQYLRENLKF